MSLLHNIAISNAEEMMSWKLSLQKYFEKSNFEENMYVYLHFIDRKHNHKKK